MQICRHAPLSAAALCAVSLACSPAAGQDPFYRNPIPSRNPINKILLNDPAGVDSKLKEYNLRIFGTMSTRLPVCIAYVMDDQPLSGTFREALAVIARSLQATPARLVAMQAQRQQDDHFADPVSHLLQINAQIKELPKRISGVPFDYRPLTDDEFRVAAVCPGKETLLITAGELQLYDRQLPATTLFSGQVPLDSVLFLILTGDSADDIKPRRKP